MKIKQQKQIKAFLEKEFGKPKGNSLLEEQEKILGTLIENIKNKSKNQKKTLVQTILPGIALYKALVQKNIPEEEAYACMQKYMFGTVGENMHASMRKMELVPGFYTLYSHIFLKVMQDTDLQESVQEHGRDYFDVTIHKCLWHTTCVEDGCPELCRLFCDTDNVTYGGLKKLGFSRTKTLGAGEDCCDFHFYNT